jgi:hypothetical protein
MGAVDWIGLAQNKDRWRALVNVKMNFPGEGGGYYCETDHLLTTSAEIKNSGAVPPLPHTSSHRTT